jgi:hypothetical protein
VRYAYAKWLVEFVEEHGIGLGDGELAEVEEAEFRMSGAGAGRDAPAVESDLVVTTTMLGWEPEVLGSIAHELLAVFEVPQARDDDGR